MSLPPFHFSAASFLSNTRLTKTMASSNSIQPYTIAVPDSKLLRLKQKLAVFDLPDDLPDAEPWLRGPPVEEIKRLAKYWADGYDWRKHEAKLNELPHFTTKVDVDGFDTYDVHFIHQRSEVKNAIPLLFAHGWPGNFLEVTKILPLLVKGGKDHPAFHVVAPSLVDFGFSAPSMKVWFFSVFRRYERVLQCDQRALIRAVAGETDRVHGQSAWRGLS